MSQRNTIEDLKKRYGEYEGYTLWKEKIENARLLREMEVRKEDVIVTGFPRSGTSLLQEIVWLVCNDADTEKAQTPLRERAPFVEFSKETFRWATSAPGQRFIKIHMPVELLPRSVKEVKPKILYIARNPKDMLVSYYYFLKIYKYASYSGTLEELHKALLENQFPHGPWWKHVLGFWLQREEENVIFLTYEDIMMDPTSVVKKIAKFLNKELTDQQISTIVEHTSFHKMKVNKAVNFSLKDYLFGGVLRSDADTQFVRKGKVGDWRNHFTEEMSDAFDKMVEERLHPHGLKFKDTLP